jgi:hypothetical protein
VTGNARTCPARRWRGRGTPQLHHSSLSARINVWIGEWAALRLESFAPKFDADNRAADAFGDGPQEEGVGGGAVGDLPGQPKHQRHCDQHRLGK